MWNYGVFGIGITLSLILKICLTVIAFIGFGIYLWYLKSSDDQCQYRLLNILNGYLSMTCIGLSLSLLFLLPEHNFIVRFTAVLIIAVSSIFLLISAATILNHFKPGLYLDISLSWSHKIAIPSLILAFILTEQALNFSCPDKFLKCEVFRVRTMVMIPATLTSFLCQLLVIIDDIWGWKNIYNRLQGLFRQNIVSPANVEDMELQEIETHSQQVAYDPALGLDQHLVSYTLILSAYPFVIFSEKIYKIFF